MRNVLGYVFNDLIYTVFIRLNAAAFITFFMIRVRRLLKNQLLFVNNARVADHFNLKKTPKHVLVLLWKVICYIVLNFTICMFVLLQYIKWIKILSRVCFLDIRTGTFKRICAWFTQNLQLQSKQWSPCAFWVYYSNKHRMMMRRLFEGGV